MDPLLLVAVAVLALIAALGATVTALFLLVRAQDAERRDWARERWELNSRIQAPQVAAVLPPPDTARTPVPKREENDAEPLRLDLVGTVVA